jgi:hypothetical protein
MGLNKLHMRGTLVLDLLFVHMDLCHLLLTHLYFLLQHPQVTMYLLVYLDDIILVNSSVYVADGWLVVDDDYSQAVGNPKRKA